MVKKTNLPCIAKHDVRSWQMSFQANMCKAKLNKGNMQQCTDMPLWQWEAGEGRQEAEQALFESNKGLIKETSFRGSSACEKSMQAESREDTGAELV